MKKIEELRNYLLENCVNERGDLILNGLDFSEFDGDVYIDSMKVQGDLIQSNQEVKGTLHNANSKYGRNLYETPSTKLLKEISMEELDKMGYKLKGEK